MTQLVKNPPAIQETWVSSLGWENPLEKEMATHSIILAWEIQRTEEPGRLQPPGLKSWTCTHCCVQFSWVTQSYPTLFDPIDCSAPGFPITNSQSLLKLMSIKSVMPSIHLILCHPLLPPSIFPIIRVFPMSQFFGVSASASVLPMNIQNWSPLGWTDWISLQSKGFSRVFSNTTVQKHQFFGAQLSL